MDAGERAALIASFPEAEPMVRPIVGSSEFINGTLRYCLWIADEQAEVAYGIPPIAEKLKRIREYRLNGSDRGRIGTETPYKFERTITSSSHSIIVPAISSQNREFLPCGLLSKNFIISNKCYALSDSDIWHLSILTSKLHRVWVATVCVRMRTDFSYSNSLGWNTFPVPPLTEQNKADLTRCAEDILLTREAHFPATIADLYDPNKMPADLREAHERNDEVLERIYIGRRFRNDTERLEKLFEMYTKMTTKKEKAS